MMNNKLIFEIKKLLLTRYPCFASEVASANIEFRTDLKYHTAGTDGKNIYFDPNYYASLSDEHKIFLIAHEIMHIRFAHMFRLFDRNTNQKRDLDVWNEATDAIINANLQRDGFTIPLGCVNRPEALNYTAEEFYEILLKEKESNPNQNNRNPNFNDDHSMWKEAFEKHNSEDDNMKISSDNSNEVENFSKNREERRRNALENYSKMQEKIYKNSEHTDEIKLGDVGSSNNCIDWKLLLRKEFDKSDVIWSQRRSIAENNYAYRLEDVDIEDEAETEVLIDVSGSVNISLVKSFLRIIKPILRSSKLKVGCFNAKFWGFVDIKSDHDIDNFIIPSNARSSSYAWTENFDLAVRSFTSKKEVNKLVFTDGIPAPGVMPKEDLRSENIIWVVYGNENFKPCCGKVIIITSEQLKDIYNLIDEDSLRKIK